MGSSVRIVAFTLTLSAPAASAFAAALLLASAALAQPPLLGPDPGPDGSCPEGYTLSGSFCWLSSFIPEYGTYACVAQRLVGITAYPDKSRPLVRLTPSTTFLVTIKKIDRPVACDPTNTSELAKPGTYLWWWDCDARNDSGISRSAMRCAWKR
jgi:hypothetical protein